MDQAKQKRGRLKDSPSKRMARMMFQLFHSFPEGGMTFEDFFDENCQVDSRQVQRMIKELKEISEEAGVTFHSPGPGRQSKSNPRRFLLEPPFLAHMNEQRLFWLSLMLERMEKRPMAKSQERNENGWMLYHLLQIQKFNEYTEKMKKRILYFEPQQKNSSDISSKLDLCTKALGQELIMRIRYNNRIRRIHPLGLFNRDERWYLVAYCLNKKEERIFRLDRMKDLEVSNEPFVYPENFSLVQHLENTWSAMINRSGKTITVRIHAEGTAAEDLRNIQYHHSQQLEDNIDGSVTATFNVDTWEGMISWVLRWGALIEVLEPLSFRERLREIAEAMAGKYRE
ncbi:helix-turn-helix transcriptional regulator [Heliorestis convoluta]|uniref:Transcriptional regulator n=1 Tax=Heliorestis convoluta TaxID=356322 RepID=A0A5Q2MYL0_9FIRM|nr:WYL domain-containing protein [Heliorestis convoluta]QGG48014.1 Transcriptional regulator [Heliorestis convoluta]